MGTREHLIAGLVMTTLAFAGCGGDAPHDSQAEPPAPESAGTSIPIPEEAVQRAAEITEYCQGQGSLLAQQHRAGWERLPPSLRRDAMRNAVEAVTTVTENCVESEARAYAGPGRIVAEGIFATPEAESDAPSPGRSQGDSRDEQSSGGELGSHGGGSDGSEDAQTFFQTPSGNIACFTQQQALDCTVLSDRRPDGRFPSYSLPFDGAARRYVPDGDPPADNPVLGYGEETSVGNGAISCTSAEEGLTCRNDAGHGYFLSRDEQRLF